MKISESIYFKNFKRKKISIRLYKILKDLTLKETILLLITSLGTKEMLPSSITNTLNLLRKHLPLETEYNQNCITNIPIIIIESW